MSPKGGATFSLAEKTGCMAFLFAFLLLGVAPCLAIIPLLLFLLLCLGAPFFPRFPFFLPLISGGKPGTEGIALTFDDGPSPSSTPILLNLLARHGLQATFFVIGEQAAAHPELIAAILAHGHTIGNHSWRHDNLLMLRSSSKLAQDIRATQEILQKAGIQSHVFRPPAGITNPRLKRVLANAGMLTVTFSCRIFDRGNRNIRNLSERILRRLRPGAIVLLHDSSPPQKEMTDYWQEELERLFSTIKKTQRVVPLAELIEHPVMTSLGA